MNILSRAIVSALATVAYVLVLTWFMNNASQWVGQTPGWLGPSLFLMVFIISASITGSLVLLKPILLYVEGQKKEAVTLFVYTIGVLVAVAVIIAGIVMYRAPEKSGDVFCTQDARQCPDGSYVGRTGPKCEFAPCSK